MIPIDSEDIQDKIKQTFLLQFFKEVVISRLFDDTMNARLDTMIISNQGDIIDYILSSNEILNGMFSVFDAEKVDVNDPQISNILEFVKQLNAMVKGNTMPFFRRFDLYR